MFKKIMIPVDLKHTAQLDKALHVAASLARNEGAELHAVGVTLSGPTEIARTPGEFAEKLEDYAHSQADALGVPIQPHARISHDMTVDLDDVLMRTADDIDADLVVMASHVPGLAEYVFASNAGHLASHASISVLVVR